MTADNHVTAEHTLVHLTPLSIAHCTAIAAGERQSNWAGDYPSAGDRFIALGTLERPEEPFPWCHYQVLLASGLLIGGAGFHGAPVNETVEIGYGIVGSQRGRGCATQAVALLLQIAQEAREVAVVRATTLPTNRASQRVLEHLNFSRIQDAGEEFVYLKSVE
ncbi:MAG: GNAT family N-acetyltransferase [Ferrimicrobium sp.]|uniref:GNAT family N-acetyltransferase n=1 Tax=Ferrimicrobium sp. TaxID=2926050 RepID=UPI00262AAED0|nr:GNAT family N-acetyltransferase [Ferrimicrobium sp.]